MNLGLPSRRSCTERMLADWETQPSGPPQFATRRTQSSPLPTSLAKCIAGSASMPSGVLKGRSPRCTRIRRFTPPRSWMALRPRLSIHLLERAPDVRGFREL